jgi:hypothetical protein
MADDERVIALTAAYSEHLMASMRFGWVFALYRLARKREAAEAAAHADMPLVRDHLVRSRVRKPEVHPATDRPGGADQAWLYREEARHHWAATHGALKWLQRILPSAGA